MTCDVVTVLTGFKLLEGVGFTRPAKSDATALAENYARLMRELSSDCVAEAFDRYAKGAESTYWPRPGKIRQLALDVRKERPMQAAADLKGRYMAWENRGWRDEPDGGMTACPVCAVIPQDVMPEKSHRATREPTPLFRVPHDRQRHREASVPALG